MYKISWFPLSKAFYWCNNNQIMNPVTRSGLHEHMYKLQQGNIQEIVESLQYHSSKIGKAYCVPSGAHEYNCPLFLIIFMGS